MFRRTIIFFTFLLIAVPQFASAAPNNGSPPIAAITPSPTPPIQTPAPIPTPAPAPSPAPSPIPIPTPIPDPPLPDPTKLTYTKFALTFDDGPSPNFTPQVISILDKFGAHGTFFILGDNFTQYPKLIQQITEQGNEIAAHSMTHPDPDYLSNSELDYEITASVAILQETSGQPVHYFRAPYGKSNYIYTKKAAELAVKIVNWTVDPRDWSGISSDIIAERVLDHLAPGCIVLLHDGGGYRQKTVDALEIILSEANARGYQSVTLSNLGI